jgi:cytidine deaminase
MITIDWQDLRDKAAEAAFAAYAPYSGFKVGCAILGDDGVVYTGCNVENASYGLTLCAECGALSALVRNGAGGFVAFVCTNEKGEEISPCGRCRQVLCEISPYALCLCGGETTQLLDLLPGAFSREDMDPR